MKSCSGCNEVLSLENFVFKKSRQQYVARCKTCTKKYAKSYRSTAEYKQKFNQRRKERYHSEPEYRKKHIKNMTDWVEKNKDYYLEKQKTAIRKRREDPSWWDLNKDKLKKTTKNWARKNPDKLREYSLRYRGNKSNFKPTSDDFLKIKEIYTKCQELACGNIKYHVDHIIPLNHPDICGLHSFLNLQILTESENCKKRNLWDGTYDNSGWRTK
jgi:hypothetical protein